MNTDIRIAVSFKGHRKRKKLKMMIGPEATDYLLDLWISTAQNRPDGILVGMDEVDIALDAGWNDDPGIFVDALIKAGFLDIQDDGTYCLHDWNENQPWVVNAPARSKIARNAARTRWENNGNNNNK